MKEIVRKILLVEDNENDAFLTMRVLRSVGIANPVHHCWDGQAVVDYLESMLPLPATGETNVPDLILLDLKIPRLGGLEVLSWIRQHEVFHGLFVLALTSSSEDRDVEKAYRLKINGYLVKPSSLDEMTALAQSIRLFWLEQPHLVGPFLPLASAAGKMA
jgi:two-component system response regulator